MDEEIEYLEEYEDLILPRNNSKKMASLQDDEDSSSIDQEIFETLFDSNSDDDGVMQKKGDTKSKMQCNRRVRTDSIDLLVKDLVGEPSTKYPLLTSSTPAGVKKPIQKVAMKSSNIDQKLKSNLGTPTTSNQKMKSIATVRPTLKETIRPSTSKIQTSSVSSTEITSSRRPPTIVTPERSKTNDPVEDPLGDIDDDLDNISDDDDLDDTSSYSLSDTSGETFHSLSDFDGNDDDEDDSRNVIELSNDSCDSNDETNFKTDNLHSTTPSPTVSDDGTATPSNNSSCDLHNNSKKSPKRATVISDTLLTTIDTFFNSMDLNNLSPVKSDSSKDRSNDVEMDNLKQDKSKVIGITISAKPPVTENSDQNVTIKSDNAKKTVRVLTVDKAELIKRNEKYSSTEKLDKIDKIEKSKDDNITKQSDSKKSQIMPAQDDEKLKQGIRRLAEDDTKFKTEQKTLTSKSNKDETKLKKTTENKTSKNVNNTKELEKNSKIKQDDSKVKQLEKKNQNKDIQVENKKNDEKIIITKSKHSAFNTSKAKKDIEKTQTIVKKAENVWHVKQPIHVDTQTSDSKTSKNEKNTKELEKNSKTKQDDSKVKQTEKKDQNKDNQVENKKNVEKIIITKSKHNTYNTGKVNKDIESSEKTRAIVKKVENVGNVKQPSNQDKQNSKDNVRQSEETKKNYTSRLEANVTGKKVQSSPSQTQTTKQNTPSQKETNKPNTPSLKQQTGSSTKLQSSSSQKLPTIPSQKVSTTPSHKISMTASPKLLPTATQKPQHTSTPKLLNTSSQKQTKTLQKSSATQQKSQITYSQKAKQQDVKKTEGVTKNPIIDVRINKNEEKNIVSGEIKTKNPNESDIELSIKKPIVKVLAVEKQNKNDIVDKKTDETATVQQNLSYTEQVKNVQFEKRKTSENNEEKINEIPKIETELIVSNIEKRKSDESFNPNNNKIMENKETSLDNIENILKQMEEQPTVENTEQKLEIKTIEEIKAISPVKVLLKKKIVQEYMAKDAELKAMKEKMAKQSEENTQPAGEEPSSGDIKSTDKEENLDKESIADTSAAINKHLVNEKYCSIGNQINVCSKKSSKFAGATKSLQSDIDSAQNKVEDATKMPIADNINDNESKGSSNIADQDDILKKLAKESFAGNTKEAKNIKLSTERSTRFKANLNVEAEKRTQQALTDELSMTEKRNRKRLAASPFRPNENVKRVFKEPTTPNTPHTVSEAPENKEINVYTSTIFKRTLKSPARYDSDTESPLTKKQKLDIKSGRSPRFEGHNASDSDTDKSEVVRISKLVTTVKDDLVLSDSRRSSSESSNSSKKSISSIAKTPKINSKLKSTTISDSIDNIAETLRNTTNVDVTGNEPIANVKLGEQSGSLIENLILPTAEVKLPESEKSIGEDANVCPQMKPQLDSKENVQKENLENKEIGRKSLRSKGLLDEPTVVPNSTTEGTKTEQIVQIPTEPHTKKLRRSKSNSDESNTMNINAKDKLVQEQLVSNIETVTTTITIPANTRLRGKPVPKDELPLTENVPIDKEQCTKLQIKKIKGKIPANKSAMSTEIVEETEQKAKIDDTTEQKAKIDDTTEVSNSTEDLLMKSPKKSEHNSDETVQLNSAETSVDAKLESSTTASASTQKSSVESDQLAKITIQEQHVNAESFTEDSITCDKTKVADSIENSEKDTFKLSNTDAADISQSDEPTVVSAQNESVVVRKSGKKKGGKKKARSNTKSNNSVNEKCKDLNKSKRKLNEIELLKQSYSKEMRDHGINLLLEENQPRMLTKRSAAVITPNINETSLTAFATYANTPTNDSPVPSTLPNRNYRNTNSRVRQATVPNTRNISPGTRALDALPTRNISPTTRAASAHTTRNISSANRAVGAHTTRNISPGARAIGAHNTRNASPAAQKFLESNARSTSPKGKAIDFAKATNRPNRSGEVNTAKMASSAQKGGDSANNATENSPAVLAGANKQIEFALPTPPAVSGKNTKISQSFIKLPVETKKSSRFKKLPLKLQEQQPQPNLTILGRIVKLRKLCIRINRSTVKNYFLNIKLNQSLLQQSEQMVTQVQKPITDSLNNDCDTGPQKQTKTRLTKQSIVLAKPSKKSMPVTLSPSCTSSTQSLTSTTETTTSTTAIPAQSQLDIDDLSPKASLAARVRQTAAGRANVMTIPVQNRRPLQSAAIPKIVEPREELRTLKSNQEQLVPASATSDLLLSDGHDTYLLTPMKTTTTPSTLTQRRAATQQNKVEESIKTATPTESISSPLVSNSVAVGISTQKLLTVTPATKLSDNVSTTSSELIPFIPVEPKSEIDDESNIPPELASKPTQQLPIRQSKVLIQHPLTRQASTQPVPSLSLSAANRNGVRPLQMDINGIRIYSFLHPSKYNVSHGNVLLDYCCPNLDGPMLAIDPTRIHTEVQTPVVELPENIVMTTRLITRDDLAGDQSSIPASIRQKVERLTGHTIQSGHPAATAHRRIIPAASSPSMLQKLLKANPAPMSSSSLSALQKQLPATTTLTPKIMPSNGNVLNSSLPPLTPLSSIGKTSSPTPQQTEYQKTLLRSNIRRFDASLYKHSTNFLKLTYVDRQRVIDNFAATTSLTAKDVDNVVRFIEEFGKQVTAISDSNLSTAVTPTSNTPTTLSTTIMQKPVQQTQVEVTTTPRPSAKIAPSQQQHVPIYDTDQNIIGYQLQVTSATTSTTTKTVKTRSSLPHNPNVSNTITTVTKPTTGVSTRSSLPITGQKPLQQDPPRIFYTKQPLAQTISKQIASVTPELKSTTAGATPTSSVAGRLPTRLGRDVIIRPIKNQGTANQRIPIIQNTQQTAASSSMGQNESITTTTTVILPEIEKRMTRKSAAASKVVVITKDTNGNPQPDECILPDNADATQIKHENLDEE